MSESAAMKSGPRADEFHDLEQLHCVRDDGGREREHRVSNTLVYADRLSAEGPLSGGFRAKCGRPKTNRAQRLSGART